jgi:hypothetical protein
VLSGDGEYLAIGALFYPYINENETLAGDVSGRVHIYKWTGSTYQHLQAVRLGEDLTAFDLFGFEIVLGREGEYLFATALYGHPLYGSDGQDGVVAVFQRSAATGLFERIDTLQAADPFNADHFRKYAATWYGISISLTYSPDDSTPLVSVTYPTMPVNGSDGVEYPGGVHMYRGPALSLPPGPQPPALGPAPAPSPRDLWLCGANDLVPRVLDFTQNRPWRNGTLRLSEAPDLHGGACLFHLRAPAAARLSVTAFAEALPGSASDGAAALAAPCGHVLTMSGEHNASALLARALLPSPAEPRRPYLFFRPAAPCRGDVSYTAAPHEEHVTVLIMWEPSCPLLLGATFNFTGAGPSQGGGYNSSTSAATGLLPPHSLRRLLATRGEL